jgi:IS30 family transposase
MRGSVTFPLRRMRAFACRAADNDTCFARHQYLRNMLSATTYFCDACAPWQKGGIENANGRIQRWLPRGTDLDEIEEDEIQDIAMTINLTPRKCLGYRSPVEEL